MAVGMGERRAPGKSLAAEDAEKGRRERPGRPLATECADDADGTKGAAAARETLDLPATLTVDCRVAFDAGGLARRTSGAISSFFFPRRPPGYRWGRSLWSWSGRGPSPWFSALCFWFPRGISFRRLFSGRAWLRRWLARRL